VGAIRGRIVLAGARARGARGPASGARPRAPRADGAGAGPPAVADRPRRRRPPRTGTVGECARLQTFPDGWPFADRDDDALLRQIGNAVPPDGAAAVMAAVARALD
jgi:site-specific DNA-cytosine methylase